MLRKVNMGIRKEVNGGWSKRLSDSGKYRLLFEFIELKSKNIAIEIEKMEIQEYFKKHLESPPLNANIPQRRKWLDELKDKRTDRTKI